MITLHEWGNKDNENMHLQVQLLIMQVLLDFLVDYMYPCTMCDMCENIGGCVICILC